MNVGLRWLPVWSSSPVKDSSPGVRGARYSSPFHRMIWERFSISLWDKACLLGHAGPENPSSPSRLWPFKPDCVEWASRDFQPLFFDFFFPRIIFPSKGSDDPDSGSFPWSINQQVEEKTVGRSIVEPLPLFRAFFCIVFIVS